MFNNEIPAGAVFTFNVDSASGRQTVSAISLGMLPDGRVKGQVSRMNDTHQTAVKVGDLVGIPRDRVLVWNSAR